MSYNPWMGNLVVDNRWGNYGTVKLLLDETMSGQSPIHLSVSVEIAGQGANPNEFEVQVFTNLNRRDFAKTYEPLAQSEGHTSYWVTFPMSYAAPSYDNLVYRVELPVQKCGAYRLTTRYRRVGSDTWWWNNSFPPAPNQQLQRDCAVVVSPHKAARVRLYEANALTVEAMRGGSYENRSTLDDFLSINDFDGFNPFSLEYISKELSFNTLWLMPVFPNTRWRWDRSKWDWAQNDDPGSPYSSRDYWSLNRWLADNANSDRAMELLQMLFQEGKDNGLDVFIDVAFNHAGRDVIFGEGGIDLGFCSKQEAENWIRDFHSAWCTRGVAFENGQTVPYYRQAAGNSFECAVWAPGDRVNEHVWDDANVDWFFGDYSSLGPKNGFQGRDYWGNPVSCWDPRGSADDERDLYYTDLGSAQETEKLWQFFGYIVPYWIEKSGGKLAGLRADFAQGLPSQLWEYIVNRARKARWDFVFLAEVLDPDQIQYRMNRVFDVLTTKNHYLYRKNDLRMSELYSSLENEVRVLGWDTLIMHNGTSHDEVGNSNMWAMTARYAVVASLYGVPMVFMSQPLGLADKLPFRDSWANMYQAWTDNIPEREAVGQMYRRINDAREATAEFLGSNRYFLSMLGGGFFEEIFSMARWLPDGEVDAVTLVFVNLSIDRTFSATFAIPRSIRLVGNYQVRNLVSDHPEKTLWPQRRSAGEIYENGVYVSFSYPNEVQYLRLEPARN
jgi:hypothetical protein